MEVYPRPDGTIYICGIGGSDYITTSELKDGAFRGTCEANDARADAAKQAFQEMSSVYKKEGELDRVGACMRPCPPDAMPYMGKISGYEGAYINAGHNCWYVYFLSNVGRPLSFQVASEADLISFLPRTHMLIVFFRGIAWAPACGKAISELVLHGHSSSINLEPFDPSRFTTKVSGRGRKRRGESVGEQW